MSGLEDKVAHLDQIGLVITAYSGNGFLRFDKCASLLHYDFYWLSREIKQQTGKNYTDLLQEKRMAQAAFLLRTTKMKVADIPLSVGYENVSYFHRLFGKTYGLSPKKYRDAI